MENQDKQARSDSLCQLLRELSASENLLKNDSVIARYCKCLEVIYYDEESGGKANFRHRYSDIYSVLSDINEESQAANQDDGIEANTGNLTFLTENLQTIKDSYIPKNLDKQGRLIDVSKEIGKLWDHVNLDKSRIDYMNTIMANTNARIKALEVDIQNCNEVMQKLTDVQQQMEGMQREYITILGIFAAIVLTFTGAMSFTASTLENMSSASIHRVLLTLLIAGLVLCNLIGLLLQFIREINGRATWKNKYLLLLNIVFVLLIILVCLAYQFNWLSS